MNMRRNLADGLESSMTCEEYAWTGGLAPRIAETWDALAARSSQAPLFRYREWSELLCREGKIWPWKIILIYDNGRPIALFPLNRSHPWCVRVVDEFAECEAPWLIADGEEEYALTQLARWFRQQSAMYFLSLGLCADEGVREHLNDIFKASGVAPVSRPLLPVVKLPVPDSWEAYLAGLGAGTRGKIKQLELHLYRDYPGAKVEWITSTASESARDEGLQALVRLHQQRWEASWSGSVFAREHNVRFFLRMMQGALIREQAVLFLLYLEQTVVAAMTLLHVPGQHTGYCHYLARDAQALPARYSTGKIMVCQAIRCAMQRKIRELNLSVTSMDYKIQLGGAAYEQHDLLYARYAGMVKLSRPLDFAYQALTHPLPETLRHIRAKLHEGKDLGPHG